MHWFTPATPHHTILAPAPEHQHQQHSTVNMVQQCMVISSASVCMCDTPLTSYIECVCGGGGGGGGGGIWNPSESADTV